MPQTIIFLISGNYFFYPILFSLILFKKRFLFISIFLIGVIQSLIFFYPLHKYQFLINKKIWTIGVVESVKRNGFILLVKDILWNHKKYHFNSKVYIHFYNHIKFFNKGDTLKVQIKLKKPKKLDIPGSFNFINYLKGKQILFTGYVISNKLKVLKRKKNLFKKYRDFIRKLIEEQNVNEKIKYFEKGIILGDKKNFPYFVKTFLNKNGISHLFVISGLHIGIIFVFLLFLLRGVFYSINNYFIPFLIALLFTGFYVILAGMEYPALRAFFLLCLGIVALFVKRKRDSLKIFYSILFVLILIRPFSYLNISLEYSFIIVFFLILFFRFYNIRSNLNKVIFTTLICFLASLPLTCYYFNEIHLKGLIVNLFAVPFFSFFIIPLALVFLFIPFKFLLQIISSLFYFFIKIVSFFPQIPCFFPFKPTFIEIFLWYLILYVFIILFKKEYFFQKFSFLMFLILISLILNQKIHKFENRVGIINLRRTKAVIFNYKHKNILINGGNKDLILGFLLYHNIHTLDYLILTEYKKIFLKSTQYLLANFNVKNFYYPNRFGVKIPDFVKLKNKDILINNFKINFKNIKYKYYEISLSNK